MPVADRCREPLGGIGLGEVPRAFDDDGPVIGEGLLPSLQLLAPECDVGVTPDDEGRQCGKAAESSFDVGEKGTAGGDLARKDGRCFPTRGAARAFW